MRLASCALRHAAFGHRQSGISKQPSGIGYQVSASTRSFFLHPSSFIVHRLHPPAMQRLSSPGRGSL